MQWRAAGSYERTLLPGRALQTRRVDRMSATALLRPGIAAEEAMKKAFVLAVGLGLGTAALANVKTESIKVSGWKCEKCPAKTEAKLKAVNGVESASADREKGQVVVKYDVGCLQHLQSFHREQVGIARPGAHQKYLTVHKRLQVPPLRHACEFRKDFGWPTRATISGDAPG